MLSSNTRLAVKPSKFDHDEINIHSSATQHYGRNTALRGMLAALGFTPLFTRVERLSAGLALSGGASAAGMGAAAMGAAGTGPTGMGTALGFTPLFSRVERLSAGLTGGASAAGMGATGMGAAGTGREEWGQQEWVRKEARVRQEASQGTVGWPEQVFPVSAVPLRQQPVVPWQAAGHLY